MGLSSYSAPRRRALGCQALSTQHLINLLLGEKTTCPLKMQLRDAPAAHEHRVFKHLSRKLKVCRGACSVRIGIRQTLKSRGRSAKQELLERIEHIPYCPEVRIIITHFFQAGNLRLTELNAFISLRSWDKSRTN